MTYTFVFGNRDPGLCVMKVTVLRLQDTSIKWRMRKIRSKNIIFLPGSSLCACKVVGTAQRLLWELKMSISVSLPHTCHHCPLPALSLSAKYASGRYTDPLHAPWQHNPVGVTSGAVLRYSQRELWKVVEMCSSLYDTVFNRLGEINWHSRKETLQT
jgi:hypothetical protein